MSDGNAPAFVRDRVQLDGRAEACSRVRAFADHGSFTEFGSRARHRPHAFGMQHKRPAGDGVVTGIGRVDGREIAVFAQDPAALGGSLVTLVDTPGFLPGTAQEAGGIIRKGAKLLYAYAEATVPRVTIVLRKAFGGAYIVMNSKSLGADAAFAWPGAELAVMGADGAVDVIFHRELASEPSRRDEFIDRYRAEARNADSPAERLSIDEVIVPGDTRPVVAATLRSLERAATPRFRHDNLPQ